MNKKKSNHWRVIPVLVLLFAVFGTTCELEGTLGKDDIVPPRVADIINAKPPLITTQPASGLSLKTTDVTVAPLTVIAEPQEEDGVLSFQWFTCTDPADYVDDAGTEAEGATSTSGTGAITATYTPSVEEEGIFYYYVIVTNFSASANGVQTASIKSDLSMVTVNDPNNAEYPNITALSGGGYYIGPTATITLTIAASVTDGGDLTYQWFSSEGFAIADGTPLSGQTSTTLTQANKSAGTYNYYVEITNTNASAGSRQISTIASPFTVNVVTPNATVTVNTAQKFQFVRGFGGMYTPWDNTPQEYVRDFERMFSPNGLGLNMLRIMILPNNDDIEDTMYEIINRLDGGGKDLSIYYDVVKVVNGHGGYVLASPWSPPASWKTNEDIKGGGTLATNRYQHFANYLKKFCQIMYDNGAPIYAFSMQNEPTFKATYAGCEYSTAEHRNWWQQVGSTFFTSPVPGYGGGKATPRVLTMTGESHNTVAPFHTDSASALQTPAANQYIDLVGRHIYGVGINNLTTPQRQGKEVWMTEHNINSGEGSYHVDSTWNYVWKFMHDVDLTIRLNQENAFIWWTAKRFYSFIGDGTNGTIDGTVLARGYGASHYAKFAKEMTRVAVAGSGNFAGGVAINAANFNAATFDADGTDVKVTAYESEDGKTISLVMYTPTDPSGGGGKDMGTVRIKLPTGFIVSRATALRSNVAIRGATENVIISNDGNSAIVTLPPSTMLSVRFTKAD